ncbi:EAL domain-containing protein [Spiroplasma taiwanense]|uniref:EAL domain-containing protein n=1 Tax=Spiroplasma taiwanense CT-1 TaxID=1276220 RepID=S5LW06_9MOLU|nr:EAL domain-containing protein [Spiroplasma taiwanense]AGR40776.1 hypothetical protein STAIW_v1c00840 [Spiroplasma taiwanense CT-1]
MNFLISLIACFSYTTIMAFFYTIFWGLTRHLFIKLTIYYELFLGFVLGFFSCFSILIISLINEEQKNLELTVLLPTFLYWISIFFISIFSSIGILTCNILNLTLFSSLFPQYFGSINNNWTMTLIIISYLMPLFLNLIKHRFKNLSIWGNWSITTLTLLLVGLIWNFSIIKTQSGILNSVNLLFWLGSGYLTYAYIAIINQIYIHALKLQNIVTYENTYYLNFSSAHKQVLNNISINKVRHGVYLTYFISNFETFESKVNGNTKDFIVNSISTETYELIKTNFSNVTFFKPNYKTFAAFIPIEIKTDFKEKNNSHIHKVEEIMKKVNTKFKIKGYKISVKLKSICSYYGLHSNNLETLLDYNRYVEQNLVLNKDQNNVIVNPIEILNEQNKNKKIISLNEVANLNQFVTLFEPIFNLSINDFDSYFLNGLIDGVEINSDLFEEKFKLINDMGLTSLFLRFISLQALKKLSKQNKNILGKQIFLNYDSDFLSSTEFNVDEFILKLKTLKLDLSKLTFNFNLNKEVNDKVNLEKNIIKLKKYKIKISAFNFGSVDSDFTFLNIYKPEFIFLEADICKKINSIKENELIIKDCINISNKIEAKLIAINVDNYISYKKLKELGISLFTGELIGSSIEPKEIISEELKFLLSK